ncbi:MAG TPA: sulfatase/phosphatase domain-containing protein [Humisphaera sp.]|nr:sulfatase/phosphatase domain-containing protein [Humisphaera sp.]
MPSRPNILFIFSDDHAYQAVSADGFGLNRTPNIDRLGTEGMRFDRCLTTYSLCGPSRACVITGKYSHLNGFYNNYNSRFDGSQVTLPKLLREAGYQTAIVGKWHLVSDPTGFDYWEVLPGQGQYYNPRMTLNGQPVRKQGYVTDIITEDSLDWLKNQRDRSKPFLLMCQHKAPHREWEPALSKLAMYDGTTFPEPPTLFDDYSGRGKAEHEQQMEIGKVMNDRDLKLVPPPTLNGEQRKTWDAHYDPIIADFKSKQLAGQDLVRWKYQRYMHDYLATISSVDDSVGKMLDYLKESGLEQNTIVVYASDQGFYLGEHGWFDKRWIFEESMRTPLLIRWPGVIKPGRVNNDIVSNLDFAETFLDAAGVPIPADMQGHSMVPLLKGQTPADWRKSFYYHYYEHPAVHNVARHYGVVTDRYKLVYFYEPEMNYWEMFDLKTDPHEMKSIYGQPDYAQVQADLHKELDRLRKELKLPDTDPPASIIPKQPAGGAMALNAWVLEYRFDKERGDTVIDASGHNNDGTAHNSPLVDGRDGHKARRFTGDGDIAVRKSPSLNPAVGAWTVEATFKSDRPDGIILAHGGTSFGYCLAIEQGKPVFTIVSNRQPERVSAGEVITGKWTTVVARFDQEHLLLEVDGKPAGRIALEHPLSRNPAESLQIGADLGTTVLATPLPRFSGLIESVRIYSGLEP